MEEKAEPIELTKEAATEEAAETPTPGGVFQTGIASWYGDDFHGKRTANGEIYDMHKLTAAHKTLAFNTLVQVENLDNGKQVTVRINDRGPFIKDRIIDLSYKAAQDLGSYDEGVAPVNLRIIKPGRVNTPTDRVQTLEKEVVTETEAANKISTPVPPPPSDSETAAETAAETTYTEDDIHARYYLQAGAFGVRENAEKMLRNIKIILPDMPFNIQSQDGLFKVLSGPLPTREKAEELKKILLDIDIDAFIKEL